MPKPAPKTQALRIKYPLSEDEAGVIYRAKDRAGQRPRVRKPSKRIALKSEEEIAYLVAIKRLTNIHHPSLFQVISGDIDPADGLPFIAAKPQDGENLADKIKQEPLSLEEATFLLSQALEASALLSELLAEDGIWLDTPAESILLIEKSQSPRFVFWPAPLRAICSHGKDEGYAGIIDLTERVLGWKGREVEEREGGHLQLWLNWLKGDGLNAPIHEVREMLAAAAGVEPPPPAQQLVAEFTRKTGLFQGFPKLNEALKWQAPKMPLFVLLCFMFVIQAIVGWFILQGINDNIEKELKQINSDYTSTPYTIDREPGRKAERGSEPLDFD